MALAANAIVSLADVKAYLRITTTDNDSLLETLIENTLGRRRMVGDYPGLLHGSGHPISSFV